GKYNLLPLGALDELNLRLGRPLRLQLKRPQLRSHPYLMGLNLLLRASGLGRVEGAGEKGRLAPDPAVPVQWEGLNPTERYFNLLEAWLLVGRPEMVGEQGRSVFGGYLTPCMSAWKDIPAGREGFKPRDERYPYFPGVFR